MSTSSFITSSKEILKRFGLLFPFIPSSLSNSNALIEPICDAVVDQNCTFDFTVYEHNYINNCWTNTIHFLVQLAGAAEYTDCTSAEGKDSTNECPRYDTKQSDGEAPVMLELWGMRSNPLLPSLPGSL